MSFLSGMDVTITAEVTDTFDTIKTLSFFAGSTELGTSAAPPYTMIWTNPPAGKHSLIVVAHGSFTNYTSRFNALAEGWNVVSLKTSGPYAPLAFGPYQPTYTSGAAGDGYIQFQDGDDEVFYFNAPPALLNFKTNLYGTTLSFIASYTGGTSFFDDADVVLVSDNGTLVLDAGPNPTTQWTTYSV